VGLARVLFCGRDTGEGRLAGAVGRAEAECVGPEDGGWAMGAANVVEERVIGALGGDEVPPNAVAPTIADAERVICWPPGLMDRCQHQQAYSCSSVLLNHQERNLILPS
jgi:hypothetical protein